MTNYVDSWCQIDIRDDPIHQKSSKGPSMSTKYECILNVFLNMLGSLCDNLNDSTPPLMFLKLIFPSFDEALGGAQEGRGNNG